MKITKSLIKLSIFLICLINTSSFAQVHFHSLGSNPKLKGQKHITNRNATVIDTLKIPFFDDFADGSIYPSSSLWLDSNVYINNNFPINPPSVGVATFDAIDKYGDIYGNAATSAYEADFLNSKPLNLEPFAPEDSLYLSFYFQPQGNGWDAPDSKDSLVLEFMDKNEEWKNVWSVSGTPTHDFKQVMISITDSSFFYKGFRFRFYNYASLGDPSNQEDAINNDFWHLDYILLDTARTVSDTTHKDICFTKYNTSLFYDFYSVPWKHYSLNSMRLDTVNFNVRNLDNQTNSVNNLTYVLYQDQINLIDSFDNGGRDIPALEATEIRIAQDDLGSSSQTYHIPSSLNAQTTFRVKRHFKELQSEGSIFYNNNDTVVYNQHFDNYYAFDDGTAENGLALVSLPYYAYKIEALRDDTLRGLSILFNKYWDHGTAETPIFSLCVWENNNGEPGELLYHEDNHNPHYSYGVNQFYTYKLKEAIYVDTTYFVGFLSDTEKLYSIGYDFSKDNQDKVFYSATGENWSSIPQGIPMIRPIMGDDFELISVPEINKEHAIKVYPNPANEIIYIESDNTLDYNFDIDIFSTNGQMVYKNQSTESKQTIDLSSFDRGLYIIRISNQKQLIYKKFIKQ
jgi:hypothetical protein